MRLLLLLCILLVMAATASSRERKLLDFGWRFSHGNAADVTMDFGFGSNQPFAKAGAGDGPAGPSFNDAAWRKVDLPHDWVVEQDFVHLDDGIYVQHGSKPTGRLFPENCIGWYRRSFDIPEVDK